ncbi:hypothetical protein [Desulforhopalus sp. IMCC35007]|uniref:hypothetical protein n=1 Tax=Desulforhopalus sp. IMCC35007 TaxID=2569543 RepID=UPI0010AEAC38|nr:hypothetical protein [Desulforhopalus sp. IMCC35007]TKB07458.1 hypothetical protein FCL48_17100 [Desulforhopalus sp. IMCC35007]
MRNLLLLICSIFLGGCAGMNLGEPERWATDQAFYSTKMPSVKLIINDNRLKLANQESGNRVIVSDSGNFRSGKEREWFKYRGSGVGLNISIETVDRGRIYLGKPDYLQKSWGVNFHSSSSTFNGKKYATAILCNKENGKTALFKAYGTTFGDDVRFQIFYAEVVSDTWLEKNPDFLTQKDQEEIHQFSKRADDSFSLAPYNGATPPNKVVSLSSEEENGELPTSYIKAKIKSSNLENDILKKHPELGRCYSLTPNDTKRSLSSLKHGVVQEITSGMDDVITSQEIKALRTSVSQGTMLQFIKLHSSNFNVDYLPVKYKKECLEFRRKYSD